MTGRASEHGAEGLQHIIDLHKQNDTEKLHSHTGFTCYNHFYVNHHYSYLQSLDPTQSILFPKAEGREPAEQLWKP
ncbi:hypothetical protein CBS63078_1182 [Aspergillus niger]|nr:hypothetical protein CBS63078_1182 [Aspergillus niger]